MCNDRLHVCLSILAYTLNVHICSEAEHEGIRNLTELWLLTPSSLPLCPYLCGNMASSCPKDHNRFILAQSRHVPCTGDWGTRTKSTVLPWTLNESILDKKDQSLLAFSQPQKLTVTLLLSLLFKNNKYTIMIRHKKVKVHLQFHVLSEKKTTADTLRFENHE